MADAAESQIDDDTGSAGARETDLDAGIGEDAAIDVDDEPEAEPEAVTQVAPQPTRADDSAPGLGSSLRRLLFGGRGRG